MEYLEKHGRFVHKIPRLPVTTTSPHGVHEPEKDLPHTGKLKMKAHDLSKESEGPTQAQKVEKAKLKGAAIG